MRLIRGICSASRQGEKLAGLLCASRDEVGGDLVFPAGAAITLRRAIKLTQEFC